jgi:hypothetical protein
MARLSLLLLAWLEASWAVQQPCGKNTAFIDCANNFPCHSNAPLFPPCALHTDG